MIFVASPKPINEQPTLTHYSHSHSHTSHIKICQIDTLQEVSLYLLYLSSVFTMDSVWHAQCIYLCTMSLHPTTHSALVVDDNACMRETLCDMLSDLSGTIQCSPESASGGENALEQLRSTSYDVVFSDVDMPDMTGFELIRRMRLDNMTTPVILMSARAGEIQENALHSSGAVSLLAKPVAPEHIHGVLQNLFTKSHKQTDSSNIERCSEEHKKGQSHG